MQILAFLDDIKSKHLGNFVLVTIGEHRISTRKITFDGDYYKPILLNIPSISESLDIEQRKYKISSVSLSISDYMEDGVRFSDSLNTLMNEEVVIWFASQSSKSLDDAECYKAGVFIVRSFSQDEDKVTLNCEDLSQDKLHKDLLGENFDSTIDKYKSKPLPMVFGQVEKSPCVATTLDTGEMGIYADDENSVTSIDPSYYGKLNTVNGQPLSVFKDDKYLNVLSDAGIVTMWGFTETTQYEIDQSPIIRLSVNSNPDSEDADMSIKSPLGFNYAGVVIEDDPIKIKLLKEDLSIIVNGVGTINTVYEAEDFNDVVEISATSSGASTYNRYSEKHIFDDLPDKVNADDDNPNYGRTYNRFIIDYNVNLSDFIGTNKTYRLIRSGLTSINTWDASTGDSNINFSESVEIDGDYSEGEKTELYNEFEASLFTQDFGASAQGQLYINSLTRHIIYLMRNFHSSNFFAQAIGRGGATPTLQSIYAEILSELDFNTNTINNELSLGSYAFTIDKKINSKKLIEEISRSSGLFPYFKDGEFNVKSIKQEYTYEEIPFNSVIYAEDILSYKYDRTKIEKVYSKVNIKYHYDYGLKDFTKETGFIDKNNIENELLEGLTFDTDQELIFESKYIRDETTALSLAKYLFGLHANQHNLITLKLPLNYLNFELGQIVRINKLIQDRKCFGEDYTQVTTRNGQQIYPFFFITSIKKSLSDVEIKLYQLHNLSNVEYIDYVEPEPEVISGCLNPTALNYNPEANQSIDDGSFGACYFPETLNAPEITSHSGLVSIPYEEIDVITGGGTTYSDNLIPDPVRNSTFDNNTASDLIVLEEGVVVQGSTGTLVSLDLGGVYPNGELIGLYVINITTGATAIITNTIDSGWSLTISVEMVFSAGDAWQIGEYTSEVLDTDWLITASFGLGGEITSGNGTLITTRSIVHNRIRLEDIQFTEGVEYLFEFKIRVLRGVGTIKMGVANTAFVLENIEVQSEFTNISFSLISPVNTWGGSSNYLYIQMNTGVDSFEIDDIIIREVTTTEEIIDQQIVNPELSVTWNPPLNMIQTIPELGITTAGYYKLLIFDNPESDAQPIYESSQIQAIENAQGQHILYLGDEDIPTGVELTCIVAAINPTQYGGGYVYSNTNTITGIPTAIDSFVFHWGDIEGQTTPDVINGDANLDGLINIVDIVTIIGHILGDNIIEQGSDAFVGADFNNDGIINIIDVVQLINEILA